MNLKKNISKLSKFKKYCLPSKVALLLFVNHKIKRGAGKDNQFGRLTDLQFNRKDKEINLEMTQDKDVTSVTIEGYRFDNRKGETFLCWDKIKSEGPDKERYAKIFKNIGAIELSKRYIFLVEAIL